MPSVAQRLINAGSGEPLMMPLDQFAAMVRRDYERYGEIIRQIGLKVD
jgi:hypothetical protein